VRGSSPDDQARIVAPFQPIFEVTVRRMGGPFEPAASMGTPCEEPCYAARLSIRQSGRTFSFIIERLHRGREFGALATQVGQVTNNELCHRVFHGL
jgi:hypothetical protein